MRGKAWDSPPVRPPRRSVQITGPDGFEDGYELGAQSDAKAIAAVEKHLRFLVANRARPAGRYLFSVAGTKTRRETTIFGPNGAV